MQLILSFIVGSVVGGIAMLFILGLCKCAGR